MRPASIGAKRAAISQVEIRDAISGGRVWVRGQCGTDATGPCALVVTRRSLDYGGRWVVSIFTLDPFALGPAVPPRLAELPLVRQPASWHSACARPFPSGRLCACAQTCPV